MPLKAAEAEKLIDVIRGFVQDVDNKGAVTPAAVAKLDKGVRAAAQIPPGSVQEFGPFTMGGNGAPFDEEALYQRFRARFIDDATSDPVLLNLIMVQPELIVGYERKAEEIDTSSLRGRIAKLIAVGFLKTDRTTQAIRSELMRTGGEPNSGRLGQELAALRAAGFLTRTGDHWQVAPGVKVTEKQIEHKG